jgi:hypothetical protein
MDATALGTLLVGVGTVVGAAVAYLGKRGETAVTGYSSLTDQLQEERADLRQQVIERDARLAEQAALRATDQAEIARLRAEIQHLRGEGEP